VVLFFSLFSPKKKNAPTPPPPLQTLRASFVIT
jgi:hypothetical protein